MTDCIDAVYAKNETELSWSIKPDLVYVKTQTELLRLIWSSAISDEN